MKKCSICERLLLLENHSDICDYCNNKDSFNIQVKFKSETEDSANSEDSITILKDSIQESKMSIKNSKMSIQNSENSIKKSMSCIDKLENPI